MPIVQNKRLMADVPTDPYQPTEELNPVQKWVDSLSGSRGGMDASNPQHAQEIQRIHDLILQGYLDAPRVEKLAKRNPNAAGALYSALTQAAAYKERKNQLSSIYAESFPVRQVQNYVMQPDETGKPRAVTSLGKPDYDQAVLRLLSLGENERAKQLMDLREKQSGKTGTFDSLDAAYAAIGVANPRTATKQQHLEALALYQAPIVQQVAGPGGEKILRVVSRGAALNTVTPTGENIFDDDLKAITKAAKDANLSEVDTYVNSLDTKLEKYKKRTSEIPGIGGLGNLNWSTAMKSPEGREIYADAQGVIGAIMRASAGLSQTQGEADRVRAKLAAGAFNTAGDFYKAFQHVKDIYDDERASLVAGARPEAVKIWESRNPRTKLTISPWKEREKAAKKTSRVDDALTKLREMKP